MPVCPRTRTPRKLGLLFVGVLVLFFVLGYALLPQPHAAAEDLPGADVLFLVDQSGSMGGLAAGSTVHPTPNDALGLRFEAPQDFARLLAEDRLQVHPNALHRVALIYFGDKADRRLSWTDVLPGSWEELKSQMNSLVGTGGGLNAGPYASSNLNNTNFLNAFDEASKLFAELPQGESQRQRILIVLTDGQPCVPPPATPTPAAGTPTPVPPKYVSPCQYAPAHMAQLVAKAKNLFPTDKFKIFVVAMNDSTDNYWPTMKQYWETLSGNQARKVTNNSDVSRFFYDIWKAVGTTLPKPEGGKEVIEKPVPAGEVIVPPYLDTITFTLFKKRPQEMLQVFDTSGKLLDQNVSDVEISGENIYKVKVFRPLPGRWRLATTGSTDNVDIQMRAVAAQGHLISPRSSQIQYVPSTIEWQILDSRGQPLPEYGETQYRLEPVVTISAEGETYPVHLQYRGNSTYAADFTPVKTGVHVISMEAVAHDDANNPIVVYDDELGRFSVGPVTVQPVDIPGQVSEFTPLTLTYELRDAASRPVGIKSSVNISATLTTATGAATVLLKPSADGRFTADYVPTEPGTHTVAIAAVLTDAKGNGRVLTSGDGGSFTSLPPSLKPESPVGPQAQYLPLKVRYQVLDGAGNALQLLPGYQMVFTTTVQLADKPNQVLTLTEVKPGTFEASYTPDGQGNYQLASTANVQAPDGKVYRAGSHQAQVTVIPTTRVGLQLVHPSSSELRQSSRRFALDPKRFFSARGRFPIEVHLVSDDGKLLDPGEVFEDNSTVPLRLSLLGTTNKKNEDAGLTLAKTDVPGIYRAESVGLGPGSYDLKVELPSTVKTKPAFTIPGEGPSVQATVQFTENWFWVGMWALIGIVLAILIARAIIIRVNPLRGYLEFVEMSGRGTGDTLATLPLNQYNKNTVKLSTNDLRRFSDQLAAEIKTMTVKNATHNKVADADSMGGGSGAAVKLWAWDTSGAQFLNGEEVSDQGFPTFVTGNIHVKYKSLDQ